MPTSFPLQTETNRVSDFLKWMVEERFCQLSATITNSTGVAVARGAIIPGTPLAESGGVWSTVNAGSEANIDGVYVDQRTCEALGIGAVSTKQYAILARGPALVNKDALVVNDLTATPDPYVNADIVTRLAVLDIQVLKEPATRQTQTT